jgi:hypothetical protein
MNGTYLLPGAMRNNPAKITETVNQNLTNNAENKNADGKTLSGKRVALAVVANSGISGLATAVGVAGSSSVLAGVCMGAAAFGAGLAVLGIALCAREVVFVKDGEKDLPCCICPPKDNQSIEMDSGQQLV